MRGEARSTSLRLRPSSSSAAGVAMTLRIPRAGGLVRERGPPVAVSRLRLGVGRHGEHDVAQRHGDEVALLEPPGPFSGSISTSVRARNGALRGVQIVGQAAAVAVPRQPQHAGDPVAVGLDHDPLVAMLHVATIAVRTADRLPCCADAPSRVVDDAAGAEPQAGHLPLPAVRRPPAGAERAHAVVPEGDTRRRRHAHTACVLAARQAGRLPTRDEWQRSPAAAPAASAAGGGCSRLRATLAARVGFAGHGARARSSGSTLGYWAGGPPPGAAETVPRPSGSASTRCGPRRRTAPTR